MTVACYLRCFFTCRFRRQHEQLRAVIVRVLQPPTVNQNAPSSPGGPVQPLEDEAKAEIVLDPADANAIQEVNLAYENVKEVDGLDVSKDGSDAWEAAIRRFTCFTVFVCQRVHCKVPYISPDYLSSPPFPPPSLPHPTHIHFLTGEPSVTSIKGSQGPV